MNLTRKGEVMDGYNMFVLQAHKNEGLRGAQNRSLLVINMNGDLLRGTESISFPKDAASIYLELINSTTFLYATNSGITLWNIYDHTKVELDFWGHHEFEYNPLHDTFFTFRQYNKKINGNIYEYDMIEEYNTAGKLVWSLDTRDFISHTQWCPYKDLHSTSSGPVVDLLHSNSLFYDPEEDVLYYNPRNLNTIYKIDHKTGKIIWGLGEYGNFILYDRFGKQKQSLFYHAHSVQKVDDNTFILFDNDLHNQTNPRNLRSRILEITYNEITMTANESWTWISPNYTYYSSVLGDAERLPNGNRLGVFGFAWLYKYGVRLIEVNATGQIVWELNFPSTEKTIYSLYRMKRFCFSPILNTPSDMQAINTENVTVSWQTWYNFRTNRKMQGSYAFYLDGIPIESGIHIFDKFWRPTNRSINLDNLEAGDHNLTLVLADEAGHTTTDSLNISITEFYLEREGPDSVESGQENSFIYWNGKTSNPLLATLDINNTRVSSLRWNGTPITLDLNALEAGTYFVTLQLFLHPDKLVHQDRFKVTIYPSSNPKIHLAPANQSLIWNESLILSWEFFDYSPAWWELYVNNTLTRSDVWETQEFQLTWKVPILDEGWYNITLLACDLLGHRTNRTSWLTVISPTPPIIIPFSPSEVQWGQDDNFLRWEVHGGTYWTLWINRTATYSGEVTGNQIEVQIENWKADNWNPGTYNITLQVIEEGGTAATHTNWLRVWVDYGDAYADDIINGMSMWYRGGDNVLGPPDNQFTSLYFDYGNGYVTLDMGLDEEVLDAEGLDITVYARGGAYIVFVSNNLSAPTLIGNQVSTPLTLLGEGNGNSSFDLASTGLVKARYIQIVYVTGEDVELDAVEAIKFNHPPRPLLKFEPWTRSLFIGIILLSATIGLVILGKKR